MADDLEQATLPRIPRKLQKKFSTTNQKVDEVKTETKEVRSDLAEAKKDIIAEIQNAQLNAKAPKAKKASKPKAAKKVSSTSIKASKVVVIQAPKVKASKKKTKVTKTTVKSVKPVSKSQTVTKTVTKTVSPVKSTKPSKKGKKVVKPKVKLVNERQFKSLKNQTLAIEQSVKKLRVELQKSKSDKQIAQLSKTILQVRKDSNRKLDSLKKDVKAAKDATYQVSGLSEEVASMKSVISEVKDSQDKFLTEIRSRFESVENKPQTVVVAPVTETTTKETTVEKSTSSMKEDSQVATDSINKVEKRLDELTARLRQEATASPKANDVTLHVPSVQKMVHARVPEEHIAAKLVQLYFEQVASPNLKRQVDLDALVNAYVYALDKLYQKKAVSQPPVETMSNGDVEVTVSSKA